MKVRYKRYAHDYKYKRFKFTKNVVDQVRHLTHQGENYIGITISYILWPNVCLFRIRYKITIPSYHIFVRRPKIAYFLNRLRCVSKKM